MYLVRLCDSSEEKRQYQQAVQHAFGVWSRKVLGTEFVMSPAKSTVTASGAPAQNVDHEAAGCCCES